MVTAVHLADGAAQGTGRSQRRAVDRRATIAVLIVDSRPLVVEGISSLMEAESGIEVVGVAGSVDQALPMFEVAHPDVVLVGDDVPGADDDIYARLLEAAPRTRVVVVLSDAGQDDLLRVFTAGVKGLLLKGAPPAAFRDAVTTVASGGVYIDSAAAEGVIALATRGRRTRGPFGLTLQQLRVVELMAKGRTNREIGRELGVSAETVKTHVREALRKLNATDRTQAIAVAVRAGLA